MGVKILSGQYPQFVIICVTFFLKFRSSLIKLNIFFIFFRNSLWWALERLRYILVHFFYFYSLSINIMKITWWHQITKPWFPFVNWSQVFLIDLWDVNIIVPWGGKNRQIFMTGLLELKNIYILANTIDLEVKDLSEAIEYTVWCNQMGTVLRRCRLWQLYHSSDEYSI